MSRKKKVERTTTWGKKAEAERKKRKKVRTTKRKTTPPAENEPKLSDMLREAKARQIPKATEKEREKEVREAVERGRQTAIRRVVESTERAQGIRGNPPIGSAEASTAAMARSMVTGEPYRIYEEVSGGKETPRSSGGKEASRFSGMAPHLIVEALAGTGKTFTLIEGLKILMDTPTIGIVPSEQQAAVWGAMAKGPMPRSITFVAFNKSIATELQAKVPRGCRASTMHSLGFAAIRATMKGKVKVSSWKTVNILEDLTGMDSRELAKKRPTLLDACKRLVSLCKQTLVGDIDLSGITGNPNRVVDEWASTLGELCSLHDIDLNGEQEEAFRLVPLILEKSKEDTRQIDFDDMIWLPIALRLPVFQSDLLLVDEAQDLNRVQQNLAMEAGKRLILVGDVNQAIYGFAGADSNSIPRMKAILGRTDRGVECLPLTFTRRCGKMIVREAQSIVPQFEAHESNPGGSVASKTMAEYTSEVKPGDMVLCRVNAPLVSQCFRLIKSGKKANIQGRDIGEGLISTIEKMGAPDIGTLIEKVDDWYHQECKRENRKKNPSEPKLIALEDRRDCIMTFCDDAQTVEEVKERIGSIFSDGTDGILLSSVHRAKGLEANRVFILREDLMPHPMAKKGWAKDQERNLRYVAITRAIHNLIWVR